ncbi:MAG TPA: hypothetical protein VFC92_14185 [Bacteroidales bacterium]|nr:hypothetical protein [Bacteroidales bacterium]
MKLLFQYAENAFQQRITCRHQSSRYFTGKKNVGYSWVNSYTHLLLCFYDQPYQMQKGGVVEVKRLSIRFRSLR